MVEAPEEMVGKLLRKCGRRLAVAESCTGGLVSHRITNVPGSSDYFLGGITAYANEAKMRLLGVSRETLEAHGAVSRETALEMAQGVRLALGADIGLSITGIAGPGGGTPQKPVGLVWIALSTNRVSDARRFLWSGTRLQVKEQSAQAALEWLLEFLRQQETTSPSEKAQFGMEPVHVEFYVDVNGKATPKSFIWHGRTYPVDSIGRHWQDEAGQHFLVMIPGGRVFELLFISEKGQWCLRQSGRSRWTV